MQYGSRNITWLRCEGEISSDCHWGGPESDMGAKGARAQAIAEGWIFIDAKPRKAICPACAPYLTLGGHIPAH